MVRIKLDQETLGLSSIMERRTGALVKDCFQDEDTVYFVVALGELGKAIGKGGANIRAISQELNKKVRVVEFRDQVQEFIKNLMYPLAVEKIVEEDDAFVLQDSSRKTKGLLIGRDGKNLKFLNRAVQRFFGKEVKVE
ncbi:MAG TPA: NusA-like transcription termination signal-binding factor [Candidatus Nanoarchaeia archaeon]|nr:NusA-like transcription termination signal-binding factor [Candidatus Nanoarchaeia archaeon]